GIADGSITMTFRRWKRRQVVVGHRYRTGDGIIEMDAVDVVGDGMITDDAARRAGYSSREELVADLRGPSELPIYRLHFHRVDGPDPRAQLAGDDGIGPNEVAEIDGRVERLGSGRLSRRVDGRTAPSDRVTPWRASPRPGRVHGPRGVAV
ncbi:MAG TPA: hypothetical protein VLL25_19885, partial [Acidimicrobiales bacterium]|nr:hypothetical protein [Acidimicrobiales bacterium]